MVDECVLGKQAHLYSPSAKLINKAYTKKRSTGFIWAIKPLETSFYHHQKVSNNRETWKNRKKKYLGNAEQVAVLSGEGRKL